MQRCRKQLDTAAEAHKTKQNKKLIIGSKITAWLEVNLQFRSTSSNGNEGRKRSESGCDSPWFQKWTLWLLPLTQVHTIKYRCKPTRVTLRKHLTSNHIQTRVPTATYSTDVLRVSDSTFLFANNGLLLTYFINEHTNAFGEFFISVLFYQSISKSALRQTNNVARDYLYLYNYTKACVKRIAASRG